MQTKWLSDNIKYTGEQLRPLYNYLTHDVMGDSIVAWAGPCEVALDHMIDGEDLKVKSVIASDKMLHFVLELFQMPLSTAVALQRLMGDLLIFRIHDLATYKKNLKRNGDDVFWGTKKLNVSIATCSVTSSLIHYGVNIKNDGTPVETSALSDFGVEDYKVFAEVFMDDVKKEVLSIKRAMVKVRTF